MANAEKAVVAVVFLLAILFVGAVIFGAFDNRVTAAVPTSEEISRPTRSGHQVVEKEQIDVLPDGVVADRSAAYNKVDQYRPIVSAYGPPDKDDSTAYDTPRPPLVTRIIEYWPENVRIAFAPIAKLTEPPPYVGWTLIGYIDTNTETTMSRYQAAERLKTRRQKRK
jgi:hypothetical protein